MLEKQPLKNIPFSTYPFIFWVKFIIFIIVVIAIPVSANYLSNQTKTIPTEKEQRIAGDSDIKNNYLDFINEIYDKIKNNYWEKITDQELSNIYSLAIQKITQAPSQIHLKNKSDINTKVSTILNSMDNNQKKEFSIQLSNLVLTNLKPANRAGLFSQKQKEKLFNTVQNIDPKTNLFNVLNVTPDSPIETITANYQQQRKKLEKIINNPSSSIEEKQAAKTKLDLTTRAFDTLGNQQDKKQYVTTGIESTINTKLINPTTFYIHIKKMSPTAFEEFKAALTTIDEKTDLPNNLIVDLRDNIGGSVDLMQWFLGPFIGPNTLAYEFYHQNEYKPYKTVTGWIKSLTRYKKIIILINNNTQSSAEVMAATLKKYNVGKLVSTTTKGWGTIEQVFPIENQIDDTETYSMFLVHSITLREDGLPIEGRGVEPDINMKNPNWDQDLLEYYNSPELIDAIKTIL